MIIYYEDLEDLKHQILMMGQNLSLTNGIWEEGLIGRFKIDEAGNEADILIKVTRELTDH